MTTAARLLMFDLAESRVQGLDSLRQKAALEIRQRNRQFLRCRHFRKRVARRKDLFHLREVSGIVSAQIDYAPIGQSLARQKREALVDEAVLVMAALGPRIRKVNMH